MVAQKENCQATTQEILQTHLEDRFWRLNNLYYILTEQAEKILFQMNPVQILLYRAMWWLNIIPKSRQHGITTFIAILMLDACLFNSDIRAGIIAHKLLDAKKIFRDKIKYAYDRLPTDLKESVYLVKDDAQELMFSNNSGIYVGTSMRSGTLQYLHVSEYGWICTHAVQKAAEIKAGAMETVHEKGFIFIESTFEGPNGDFPEMCEEAENVRLSGRELGSLDYKIHFFNWHQKVSNVTDPRFVEILQERKDYFDKLEKVFNKKFTPEQRAWYVAKKKTLKHLMFKEHPSTLDEARIAGVEGAYYTIEMSEMREQGRICRVPFIDSQPVHTVCDLGIDGNMPWIFFQVIGLEVHIVNCFNLSKRDDVRGGAAFYKRMLDVRREQFKYSYGKYFCPFDINKGEISTGETIYKVFQDNGITFCKLDRETNVIDGIQRMRTWFPTFYIDSENCRELITAWSCYHQEWIENLGRYDAKPANDQYAHYADAGRYLSEVIDKKLYIMDDRRKNTQTSSLVERSYLG